MLQRVVACAHWWLHVGFVGAPALSSELSNRIRLPSESRPCIHLLPRVRVIYIFHESGESVDLHLDQSCCGPADKLRRLCANSLREPIRSCEHLPTGRVELRSRMKEREKERRGTMRSGWRQKRAGRPQSRPKRNRDARPSDAANGRGRNQGRRYTSRHASDKPAGTAPAPTPQRGCFSRRQKRQDHSRNSNILGGTCMS